MKKVIDGLLKAAKTRHITTQREIHALEMLAKDAGTPVKVDPPKVDPPKVDPDPPVKVDPPAGGDGMYFNEDYQRTLPVQMEPRAIPSYTIPTTTECDWIVQGSTATPQSPEAGHRPLTGENLVAAILKYSHARGKTGMVKIGVYGEGGKASLGCAYKSKYPGDTDVEGTIDVAIVGLSPDARMSLRFANLQSIGYVKRLHVFNIGLYSFTPDSFVIRANEGVGEVIFDGHWWLGHGLSSGLHASSLHIDQYETLVLRNTKYVGTLFREHSVAYIKSCIGDPTNPRHGTWLVGNEIQGGRRTGWQIRPGNGDTPDDPKEAPTCPVVMCDNVSDGYGWEHDNEDGGGAMTLWTSPDQPVWVFDNDIRDSRYSCFVAAAQGITTYQGRTYSRDWINEAGFVIKELYLFRNTFENDRAKRSCVSIVGVEELYLFDNDVSDEGEITLVSSWARGKHDIVNGRVYVSPELDARFRTGDLLTRRDRDMTTAEKAEFLPL